MGAGKGFRCTPSNGRWPIQQLILGIPKVEPLTWTFTVGSSHLLKTSMPLRSWEILVGTGPSTKNIRRNQRCTSFETKACHYLYQSLICPHPWHASGSILLRESRPIFFPIPSIQNSGETPVPSKSPSHQPFTLSINWFRKPWLIKDWKSSRTRMAVTYDHSVNPVSSSL